MHDISDKKGPPGSERGIGAGTGGRGDSYPPNFDSASTTLSENALQKYFEILFLFEKDIYKIKWPKSEEKLEFGGR